MICEIPSAAINYIYKNITHKKETKYSRHFVIEFDESGIIKELLLGMNFWPFTISVDKINIFVSSIGIEWSTKWNGIDEEFCSSFTSQCWVYLYKKLVMIIVLLKYIEMANV